MKRIAQSAACAVALVIATAGAIGQQTGPTETKGVSAKVGAAVDLGPEIDGMSGRQLRTRTITIEPGGVFGVHNHKGRPETVSVLQGRITENSGGVSKEYGPGDVFSATKETTHWLENKGSAPAVFIAVDVFTPPVPSPAASNK